MQPRVHVGLGIPLQPFVMVVVGVEFGTESLNRSLGFFQVGVVPTPIMSPAQPNLDRPCISFFGPANPTNTRFATFSSAREVLLVLRVSDDSQMVGVDAGPISATMVNYHAVRDRSID